MFKEVAPQISLADELAVAPRWCQNESAATFVLRIRRLIVVTHFMEHHEKSSSRSSLAPSGRAVALLDARYLRWIARLDDPDAAAGTPLARERLNDMLAQALQRSVGRCALLRLYWYAESDDRMVCNDQTLRLLPSADADGSALVRQMTADVQALVASGRIDVLLLGSDDDRLLPVMDSAKLSGVSVCVLADERAQTMPRLMQQDPNWARVLREADRRVILRAGDLAQALQSGGASSVPQEGAGQEMEQALRALVQSWWDDLTDDDRDGLKEELPDVRGLPPEVDRDLLLRGKNATGRALNFHEKRLLRTLAREIALGVPEAAATDPEA